MRHFKLTEEEKKINEGTTTVYRIELIIDCIWGKKGEKGGWVEKENNISGDAWVSGNARVYGDAWEQSPLQIQGTSHSVNICAKGILRIGCHTKTLIEWEKEYKEIGEYNGYSITQIAEYGLYIKLAIELSKQ